MLLPPYYKGNCNDLQFRLLILMFPDRKALNKSEARMTRDISALLSIPAIFQMIVHDPYGLQKRIRDHRSDKADAALLHIRAHHS